jgi:putative transposase
LASVSRSGYYIWLKHAYEPNKDYEDYLRIKEVFDRGKGKYGWRSIKMRLEAMNHKKIQRIMRKYDLITKVRKRNPYKAIMKKRLEHRIFPNKLQREFQQIVPFKIFCTDITYIPFQNGFTYLSVIKDIASGEVVAWNVSLYLEMTLVTETVRNLRVELCEDAMIHSDQGFHYTNPDYIEIVKEFKLIQSMSSKGNCFRLTFNDF